MEEGKLEGKTIEEVKEFKYLEYTLRYNGKQNRYLGKEIRKAMLLEQM